MFAARVQPLVVTQRLGHTKLTTTLQLHGHLLPLLQRNVTNSIDQLIARSRELVAMNRIREVLATIVAVGATIAPTCAADFSCVPEFADLENPVPAHFSEQAITELKRSYHANEVRGLRSGINAYLAGDADENTVSSLRTTARSLLLRRFRLFSDDRGPFGGYYLTIQFVGRPEAMYQAWVYDVGDAWQVRGWQKASCSTAEQRWLRIRYSDLSNMAASG